MGYEPVYGFPCVEDPNDFSPDYESCSPAEIAAWKLAFKTYGKPNHQPNKGCTTEVSEDGTMVRHILRTSWGIGVNLVKICDGCKEPYPEIHCHDCGRDFCDPCWAKHDAEDEP